MATQKRPLPSILEARAQTNRTLENIFDEEYVARAFENLSIPTDIGGSGASPGEVWQADGVGGASWGVIPPHIAYGTNAVTVSETLTPNGVDVFATVADAVAVVGDGATIVIDGNVEEPAVFTITQNRLRIVFPVHPENAGNLNAPRWYLVNQVTVTGTSLYLINPRIAGAPSGTFANGSYFYMPSSSLIIAGIMDIYVSSKNFAICDDLRVIADGNFVSGRNSAPVFLDTSGIVANTAYFAGDFVCELYLEAGSGARFLEIVSESGSVEIRNGVMAGIEFSGGSFTHTLKCVNVEFTTSIKAGVPATGKFFNCLGDYTSFTNTTMSPTNGTNVNPADGSVWS